MCATFKKEFFTFTLIHYEGCDLSLLVCGFILSAWIKKENDNVAQKATINLDTIIEKKKTKKNTQPQLTYFIFYLEHHLAAYLEQLPFKYLYITVTISSLRKDKAI